MSQLKAVYLTERYCAGDRVADDLQERAQRRAVGLLCELLLEELDGPISDLGRRVQRLAEEVGEMERAVNGCGTDKRMATAQRYLWDNGRRMYGKKKNGKQENK